MNCLNILGPDLQFTLKLQQVFVVLDPTINCWLGPVWLAIICTIYGLEPNWSHCTLPLMYTAGSYKICPPITITIMLVYSGTLNIENKNTTKHQKNV
jgi:hypothetical protein